LPLNPDSNPLGSPFIELQSVDSTNKYAMTLVQEGIATHGWTVLSHEQTAGKGQRGKKWSSGKDNLAMSIIANPYPLRPSEGFQLIACTSIAVYDFFYSYAGIDTKIKWPNDIYWCDRKAGGILIENIITSGESAMGNWQWAIIGIGININQLSFSEDLPNPVSLKQVTGKKFDVVSLAKELCEILHKYYKELTAGEFKKYFNRYLQALYKKDEKVKLKKGSRVFEATIKGVSETGQLIVQHAMEERFEFGEIELLVDY
jgi:BirA family biotin operon repressor/biotin-[acetyl-CoA-carboxylase] ligase